MEVTLYTNPLPGGWRPTDLQQFLGGNEECIALFAAAMSRAGHKVTVYTSIPANKIDDGAVTYLPRETFDANAHYECLITVKDRSPWIRAVSAGVRIHWANDIEPRWSLGCMAQVQKIVILGKYMQERMAWLPGDKTMLIPLGIDTKLYTPGESAKDPKLAIYASSPDRGLETLLEDWPRIQQTHPGLCLFISYGWTNIDKWGGPQGQQLKQRILMAAQQPGIAMAPPQGLTRAQAAQLFQAAKYFIHPLNRPDSDLFGFSMLKFIECGGIPVVPQVAGCGFQETVRGYIPYRDFINGADETGLVKCEPTWPEAKSWDRIVKEYWNPLIDLLATKEAA